jgi:cystathionine beta-lyase/cystathionine gamma-synthase
VKDATRTVHGPDQQRTGSLVTPIAQTSTFVAASTAAIDDLYEGRATGHVYTRYGNPTVESCARRIAELEELDGCLLAGSGMAAIALTALTFARPGGRFLANEDLYGGTAKLFELVLPRLGVTVERFPTTDAAALDHLLATGPADLVYLESPTNPTNRLVPLAEVATIARRHAVPTAIDSTFATPLCCKPARLGIDIVIHSATKYLGGHSDLMAGAVCAPRALLDRLEATHRVTGGILDPHAAYLLERGLKTLSVRLERILATSMRLAAYLERHAKVTRVHYPGLPSHPQHALARAQMPGGAGGVVSFDLPGGKPAAARFADALHLFRNAASLGGVESLITLPIVQSHRGQSEAQLARQGIVAGTVRLAIGVEDAGDLEADVAQALERA